VDHSELFVETLAVQISRQISMNLNIFNQKCKVCRTVRGKGLDILDLLMKCQHRVEKFGTGTWNSLPVHC